MVDCTLAFAPFAPTTASAKSLTTLPLQKVVYLLCNLLTLAVGLWKCRSMGLLPTGTGDWLAFESRGMVSVVVFFFAAGSRLTSLVTCFFLSTGARDIVIVILNASALNYHLQENIFAWDSLSVSHPDLMCDLSDPHENLRQPLIHVTIHSIDPRQLIYS